MNMRQTLTVLLTPLLLAACASTGGSGEAPASSTASSAASSASSSRAASSASSQSGVKPGMNARGEVVDSSKVQSGSGTKVKVGDVEGEITGRAAANSRFNRVRIGMKLKQVTDLIGQPSDQGAYVTGKAFIPFYFGGDRHRYELVYKGTGRLIFAGEGGFGWNWGSGTLIWIIHNANEPGYR